MLQLAVCAYAPDAPATARKTAANKSRYERDIDVSPGSTITNGSPGSGSAARGPRVPATRALRALEPLHGSRQSRIATTAVVERDPPVKRDPSYPRRQRCPYVETAVSGFDPLVSRAGAVVSRRDLVWSMKSARSRCAARESQPNNLVDPCGRVVWCRRGAGGAAAWGSGAIPAGAQ